MANQAADEIIERLDFIMDATPRQVGVGMGHDLYMECARRGLLPMVVFSVLGTGFLPNLLPAYRGKHFAYIHPDLTDWDFRIGTPNA